jgi:tRNA pseudouridine13 synthase
LSFHPWQSLPFAHGGPAGRGRIRVSPSDFQVEEFLGFELAGQGEHLFVRLRQTGCNTGWVAGRLARWARRPSSDVGYAGRKDRHAVTEQWFSIRCPGGRHPDPATMEIPGVELAGWSLHDRKLKRGALKGNRFRIRVREMSADADLLEARLGAIRSAGVPNAFGPQRFGRSLANLELARAWFSGGPQPRRAERGFALSAARSLIFNAVLAERVADGSWTRADPGDPVQLDGRGSWFLADAVDATLAGRLERLEVHPTGPLWGRGEPPGTGPSARREQEIAGRHAVLADGLAGAGLDQERRALRLAVRDLSWSLTADGAEMAFELPSGSFATAVLREALEFAEGPQRTESST